MSRVLKVLGVLLTVVILLAVGLAMAAVSRARGEMHEVQAKMLADWAQFGPRIAADQARWKDDPLLARHEGGDASAVLFKHVRWEGVGDQAPPLPGALTDALKKLGPDWASHSKEVDVSSLDVQWMQQLKSFGFWDLEGEGSPLNSMPFTPLTEPIPNFIDLQALAKARLIIGLNDGSPKRAAAEVRELARLCFTSETLIGVNVGAAMLGMERKAWDEASRRGQDVEGWTPTSEADLEALKRAVWVSPAATALLATGALAKADLPVTACTGLRENLGTAYFLRGYLEGELPERYASLTEALQKSPCRLSRGRAAWAGTGTAGQLPVSGAAMCMTDSGAVPGSCWMPDAVMHLGPVRAFIGANLASVVATDWFRRYRPEAAAGKP